MHYPGGMMKTVDIQGVPYTAHFEQKKFVQLHNNRSSTPTITRRDSDVQSNTLYIVR